MQDTSPRPRDEDELITEIREFSINEFYDLLVEGKLMLPSVQTGIMALKRLKLLELVQQ